MFQAHSSLSSYMIFESRVNNGNSTNTYNVPLFHNSPRQAMAKLYRTTTHVWEQTAASIRINRFNPYLAIRAERLWDWSGIRRADSVRHVVKKRGGEGDKGGWLLVVGKDDCDSEIKHRLTPDGRLKPSYICISERRSLVLLFVNYLSISIIDSKFLLSKYKTCS